MFSDWWIRHKSTVEFATVNGMYALSTFVALWAGVLSLASVTFAAVSGYTSAALVTEQDINLLLMLGIGGVLGAVVALLASFVLLRLVSHWMAMASIALVLITRVIILNLGSATHGATGRTVIRSVTTLQLFLVLAVFAYCFARLRKSRLGLAAMTVREDMDVAGSLGVNPVAIQRIAYVLSGFVGGVAGVLQANLLQYITPDTFYVNLAFVMLASVILGGAYHWAGAVVGAAILTALPEVLRSSLKENKDLANGVILVLIMLYLPGGVVDPGRWRIWRERWRSRRHRDAGAGTVLAEASDG